MAHIFLCSDGSSCRMYMVIWWFYPLVGAMRHPSHTVWRAEEQVRFETSFGLELPTQDWLWFFLVGVKQCWATSTCMCAHALLKLAGLDQTPKWSKVWMYISDVLQKIVSISFLRLLSVTCRCDFVLSCLVAISSWVRNRTIRKSNGPFDIICKGASQVQFL